MKQKRNKKGRRKKKVKQTLGVFIWGEEEATAFMQLSFDPTVGLEEERPSFIYKERGWKELTEEKEKEKEWREADPF